MGSPNIPVLVTERLRLRAFCSGDLDAYAAMKADPEVLRYLAGAGGKPWDRGRSFRHMAYLLGAWHLGGAGAWAVEHRASATFVGVIGFAEPPGWPGCELAWELARPFWGNGYATEGACAALAHAFSAFGKDRVISLIHPENRASIRLAERLGERFWGRTDLLGQEMLRYGIDRISYRRQTNEPLDDAIRS